MELSPDRVVLGLSGGVDSSVTAKLLQADGYEVEGLFLDIGNAAARQSAEAAAERAGIPLSVLDIRSALETHVCQPFDACYRSGRTPNPCVMCNPAVKFAALTARADAIGAKWVATGHYARAKDGMLFRGRPANDQSYMLCRLKPEQAARLLLPLGGMEKTEVRRLAEEMNLPAAHTPDSMEICFIPDKDYVRWLEARGALPGPGPILFHGEEIGRHEGICRWTVGQRLPGLYQERKIYVRAIDARRNALIADHWDALFQQEFRVRELSWLIDPPAAPIEGNVRVRHTKWENPDCTIAPDGLGGSVVNCASPVRAPAPGQAAAFYQGDRLIGGGWICGEET